MVKAKPKVVLVLPGGERHEFYNGAPRDAVVEMTETGGLPPSVDEEVAEYLRKRIEVLRCSDCDGDGYGVDLEPCDSCLERGWVLWIRAYRG